MADVSKRSAKVNLTGIYGNMAFGPLGMAVMSVNGHPVNPLSDVLMSGQARQTMFQPLKQQASYNVTYDVTTGEIKNKDTDDLPEGDGTVDTQMMYDDDANDGDDGRPTLPRNLKASTRFSDEAVHLNTVASKITRNFGTEPIKTTSNFSEQALESVSIQSDVSQEISYPFLQKRIVQVNELESQLQQSQASLQQQADEANQTLQMLQQSEANFQRSHSALQDQINQNKDIERAYQSVVQARDQEAQLYKSLEEQNAQLRQNYMDAKDSEINNMQQNMNEMKAMMTQKELSMKQFKRKNQKIADKAASIIESLKGQSSRSQTGLRNKKREFDNLLRYVRAVEAEAQNVRGQTLIVESRRVEAANGAIVDAAQSALLDSYGNYFQGPPQVAITLPPEQQGPITRSRRGSAIEVDAIEDEFRSAVQSRRGSVASIQDLGSTEEDIMEAEQFYEMDQIMTEGPSPMRNAKLFALANNILPKLQRSQRIADRMKRNRQRISKEFKDQHNRRLAMLKRINDVIGFTRFEIPSSIKKFSK
jgi:hypothetical protein